MSGRFQNIMRPEPEKSPPPQASPTIDKLAKNEVGPVPRTRDRRGRILPRAVLGKDGAGGGRAAGKHQRTMRLGTLYRFEAIVDGHGAEETGRRSYALRR